METNSNKIPFNQLPAFEQTSRLTQMVQQAYFRRSRQLPTNLGDMVECLKGDLLKYLGDIPTDKLDLAITTATLDNDTPLSVAFFFAAAKKHWCVPKTNAHQWDAEDQRRPDFETDTINLLDSIAEAVKNSQKPYANWHREYSYLVIRGQISWDAFEAELEAAREHINTERVRNFERPIAEFVGGFKNDLYNEARRLAVLRWIDNCNEQECKPSDILTPLINEQEYQQFRKTI